MTTVNPEVKTIARNVISAFVSHFGRVPDQREQAILASAIAAYFNERDLPPPTLQ